MERASNRVGNAPILESKMAILPCLGWSFCYHFLLRSERLVTHHATATVQDTDGKSSSVTVVGIASFKTEISCRHMI